MPDFQTAYKETMGDEGGYSNNPHDAGGETYRGIARNFWGSWHGWAIIDQVKKRVAAQPVYGTANYTNWVHYLNSQLAAINPLQSDVAMFYKENFWDKNLLGQINDQDVANWLFNHIVNAGGRGVRWMQEAAGTVADGAMGPHTIAAINACDPADLLCKAKTNAVAYRLAKVQSDPSQRQFLHSWLSRDGLTEDEITKVLEAT